MLAYNQSLILISIHALREEGDRGVSLHSLLLRDFYPRPPRGGRQKADYTGQRHDNFYPRPPRGGRRSCRRWSRPW